MSVPPVDPGAAGAPPEPGAGASPVAPLRAATPPRRRAEWWPYAVIALAVGGLGSAFAYTAGWLGPQRLTAQRMVDAIEANGPARPGFRRAHARGVCVAGHFEANGRGAQWSRAGVLGAGRTPFVGRMSIGGGAPDGNEAGARVRSLALKLTQADRQEWRMAMNTFPVMAVATPQAFFEQTLAGRPDPATGKPDPARIAAFFAAHPESAEFRAWQASNKPSSSFATTRYHSINAFVLVSADGARQPVRWAMVPEADAQPLGEGPHAPDHLQQEFSARVAQAPVRWAMEFTLAGPDDATNDATRAWPEDRQRIVAGVVEITATSPQQGGACDGINFDPLVLPAGIEASDDRLFGYRRALDRAGLPYDPVLVCEGEFDFDSGVRGGRALLSKNDNGWRVVLCTGDALLDPATLRSAGLSADAASHMSQAVRQAESTLPESRVKQFALFEGVMNVGAEHASKAH